MNRTAAAMGIRTVRDHIIIAMRQVYASAMGLVSDKTAIPDLRRSRSMDFHRNRTAQSIFNRRSSCLVIWIIRGIIDKVTAVDPKRNACGSIDRTGPIVRKIAVV